MITLIKVGDIFVFDHGFGDVKYFMEMKGFSVLMPALKGKRRQLSTAESNESRFVTKTHWAVEAVHGIIRQKYLLIEKSDRQQIASKDRDELQNLSFFAETIWKKTPIRSKILR